MAFFKPSAGTRIIDAATGAFIRYADGKTVYESSPQFASEGRGGVGFQGGNPGPSYDTADEANGTLATGLTDVFGNALGDQAGAIYKAQANAQQQGATQYSTNGSFGDLNGQLSGVLS